jgi:hypothetical protein
MEGNNNNNTTNNNNDNNINVTQEQAMKKVEFNGIAQGFL